MSFNAFLNGVYMGEHVRATKIFQQA